MAVRPAIVSPAEPASRIERLRRKLRIVEVATGLGGECSAALAFGIPLIDRALGGGLSSGALHEIAAAREPEIAVATGFALALAARSNRSGSAKGSASAGGSVLWIA